MTEILFVFISLGVLTGAVVVLIARHMFLSCSRQDLRHDGNTPAMFGVVDPYLAELVETLYDDGVAVSKAHSAKQREGRRPSSAKRSWSAPT